MDPNEQTLTTFETRVRQMILRFQELKKENEDLQALIAKNEQDIKELQAKLTQADNDYLALKTAKMMRSLSWTRTKEYSTCHGSSMNQ